FNAEDSKNAQSYKWLLFKDTADLNNVYAPDLRDSLIETSPQEEFSYTYEHTGRYKVQLIAKNNHCQDTSKAYYVNVVESKVDVPNVFTPNGDGKNDVFMVMALSVEHFHGVILNRLGRKVYEWSDPNGGWDGRINGKYATPGTYYYIITARGLEKNNPPRYVKKGALMLIR
ncbi:MAG: gliding motility-associated C-terminal domain-containing protein, partial [Odoribacter sp.]|nr:gliding motility-associated C-terminal domain-containing protein [Odoribacter sp.]